MSNFLQVYASGVTSVAEANQMNVLIQNVDVSQVVSEFNAEEVLDCIDLGTITDYLVKAKESNDE